MHLSQLFLVLLLLVSLTNLAQAIGMCEGQTTTRQITHVALDGHLLIHVNEEFCDEEESMDVRRYVVAQSIDGRELTRFCVEPAAGVGCTPAATMAAWIKTHQLIALEAIPPKRAITDPLPFEQFGGAGCTTSATRTALKATPGAFAMTRVALKIQHGRRRVRTLKLGETSAQFGSARLIFLPNGDALLESHLATCGGPPPGYFGPDDEGECYPEYVHTVRRLPSDMLEGCGDSPRPAPPAVVPSAPTSASVAPKAPGSTTP